MYLTTIYAFVEEHDISMILNDVTHINDIMQYFTTTDCIMIKSYCKAKTIQLV